MASEAGADDEKQVVAGDDEHGKQRAGGASPAAGLRAEWDGD